MFCGKSLNNFLKETQFCDSDQIFVISQALFETFRGISVALCCSIGSQKNPKEH